MTVSSLGYITLTAQDIPAWRTFGSDIMGLMLNQSSSDDTCLYFRMDDHPSRLIIRQGEQDKLAAAGWEYADKEAYEAAISALETAGTEVARGDDAGAAQRNVAEYAASVDRAGNPFEIYHTRTGLSDDFVSPLGIEQFITGDMGMGHLVVPAPNMDETHEFYKSVMGFGDSDNLTLPPPAEGAPDMNVRFLHADNPRHHSLALYNFPVPSGIVHLILEVATIDEVGACLDRVQKAGFPLMATLGRHCNDNMLSFYAVAPGGIAVEFGCEGRQFDWAEFEPTTSTVGDFWGHDYVPPPV